MPKLNMIPFIKSDVIWNSIDGEVVVITPQDEKDKIPTVRVLNETGSMIWEMMNGKNDLKKITETICEEFSVNYEEILSDTENFLAYLEEMRLVSLKD